MVSGRAVSCALVLALCTSSLRATDIHVPGDAPTIQAGIALAASGDSVLVGPGTWSGAVDFLGKSITVRSTEGWAATLIDASGVPTFGVVLGAASGTAVLDGFTVTGAGVAQVHLNAGSSTVRRCVLRDGPRVGLNTAGSGAKLVEDCWIVGNPGGGVRTGLVTVRHCLIENNGSPALASGGGLYGIQNADGCIVRGNTAKEGGGGNSITNLDGSLFLGNTATVRGGGYYEVGIDFAEGIQISNAAFIGNHAPDTGGVYLDGGDFAQAPFHKLDRCVFSGNTDDVGNLGLWANPVGEPPNPGFATLWHCTVQDNSVVIAGVLLAGGSIVRGGTLSASGATSVTSSDVEGGAPGIGNFDLDPAFVDAAHGVFALLPGSPCVDADGGIDTDPDGSPQDVGAFVLAPFADAGRALFGSYGLPGLSGTGTLLPNAPVGLDLVRARPAASAALVLGFAPLHAAFKGGVMVPLPALVLPGLPVDGAGELHLSGTWPAGLPSGTVVWAQCWITDVAGPQGFAASNGLGFVTP